MYHIHPLLTNTMPVFTSSATMCATMPAATATTMPLTCFVAQPTTLGATCFANFAYDYARPFAMTTGLTTFADARQSLTTSATQCATETAAAAANTTETKLFTAELPIYGYAPIGSIRLQPLAFSVGVNRNFEVKEKVFLIYFISF